jgi:hypothetical protein
MGQFEIQVMPAAAWLLSRSPMQGLVLKDVPEKIPLPSILGLRPPPDN